MFDEEFDTPETLFGDAEEATVPAPAPVEPAREDGVPAKKPGRPPIGDRPMTPKEIRDRSRGKAREAKNAKSYTYGSPTEPTKTEAYEILKGRGLTHGHILDVTYDLLLEAAQENGITANRFLFQNGVQQALASYDAKEAKPLAEIPAELMIGELLDRPHLYAMWDSSISWRENLSFEEFLSIRHQCKSDCFYLGRDILLKDFAAVHEEWSHFLPRFNPDTLPPNYTQKQAINWLREQSSTINFLTLASRNSMKSSFSHVWLLSLILCQPSIRILLISETRPLSLDFMGVLRGYLEKTPGQESRFLNLFPEFAIEKDEGSKLLLEVPMAHLKLAQKIEATSMDSTTAGKRFDVGCFDDCISSTSCENDEQRKKSVKKFDALCKLREAGGGSLVAVWGTPWAHNDLYATLIDRNDKDPDKPWAVRLDPAWTRKPHAMGKKLRELEEDDVVLLFPEKLSWKFLQADLRSNEEFFMSQNLVMFPTEEDSDLKVTFSEEDLRAHTKHPEFFAQMPLIEKVMSVDQAFSKSRFADFSCIANIELRKNKSRTIAVVTDVLLDRLKQSELAVAIVEACQKHHPTRVVVEKDGPWEALMTEIKKQALLRGYVLPYFIWRESNPGNKQNAKAKRIKGLEPMIPSGELWFYSSYEWNEAVIAQFAKFDGLTKSNSSRKDDAPDAVAIGIEQFFPKTIDAEDEEDVKTQEERERQRKAAQDAQDLRKYYEHMHGPSPLDTSTRASQWGPRQEQAPPPTPEEFQQRKRTVVGGRFAALPWQGRRT
jgi:Terminase RNaseH-like domain